MEWASMYDKNIQPSGAEISKYIASPLWEDLNSFLCSKYNVHPKYGYSSCSMQPGWNVKYQKAGRSLCTLYPMPGFFIALVVIGPKEETEAELLLPTLQEYTRNLYEKTSGAGSRWLMINVTDETLLEDVKRLVQARRKA